MAGSDGSNSAVREHAEFTASEGYKQYVVWLLFIVYVFNFVDRADPVDRDRADQAGVRAARLAARRVERAGVRGPVLDARHPDRAHRRLRRAGSTSSSASLVIWSSFTAVSRPGAQLLAPVPRARRRGHRRSGLQPAGLLAASATTSSRRSARPRCRSTRWACTAAARSASWSAARSRSSTAGARRSTPSACPASLLALIVEADPARAAARLLRWHAQARRQPAAVRAGLVAPVGQALVPPSVVRGGPACVRQLRDQLVLRAVPDPHARHEGRGSRRCALAAWSRSAASPARTWAALISDRYYAQKPRSALLPVDPGDQPGARTCRSAWPCTRSIQIRRVALDPGPVHRARGRVPRAQHRDDASPGRPARARASPARCCCSSST